ncbi:alpha/beta hydrolase [Ruficoccus amylovorans]|uniref:Alpha/beta hydrolase n=1 Tax=Ruficoccus amylovorans TaxID=1804625 RepID=A0A842HC20_9BACT|nr:alpha/beta hydrolase [Ruficoccus amylovorans]MBC2593962.1 alpha/beta hydrolase [Ruficoccus amylovorans]
MPPKLRSARLLSLLALVTLSPVLTAVAEKPAPTLSDIPYLGAERPETMDAWLPPESFARPIPAVLLIHGGGWEIGDKADGRERNIAATLSAHGYAVFSINYLLGHKTKDPQTGASKRVIAWPQNFYDCKSALRYLRANAGRYGIDPARIAVMGGSAGGHLALLVGVTAEADALNQHGLYTDQSNEVACIVDLYGIHDLRQFGRALFAGKTDGETEQNLTAASPVSYFETADVPPVLVIHGTADPTVPISVSRDLVARLQAGGHEVEYLEVKGAGHSFHLQPSQADLRPVVLEFLDIHLQTPGH